MGFFSMSKGMQIGLAEGWMDQQAESRDRQERLTEDKRKEMKAAQIRARKVLDEQDQEDQNHLNITKNLLTASDMPSGLAKKLDALDTETKIELGKSLSNTVRIMGDDPSTYNSLVNQVQTQMAQVLVNDDRIRKAKTEKASQPGTTEEQPESILSAISPIARGQADRARIERGVSPEAREVMDRGFARRTRKGLEDVSFKSKEIISGPERTRQYKNSLDELTQDERIDAEQLENASTLLNALIYTQKESLTGEQMSIASQMVIDIQESGIPLTTENATILKRDMSKRGVQPVLQEIQQGNYELQQKDKLVEKKSSDTTPKKSDLSSKSSELKGKNIKDLTDKGFKYVEGSEKLKGNFLERTYENPKNKKVIKVTLNKLLEIESAI